jgi:hypothetical protein
VLCTSLLFTLATGAATFRFVVHFTAVQTA